MSQIKRNADAIAALEEYMELRDELGQMEGSGEDECSCNPDNFHTCDFCKHRGGLLDRSRILLEGWGDNWAVMLNEDTLPFQAWCECGHISGQHAAKYPHACAVDNGCEKECYGFRLKDTGKEAIRTLASAMRKVLPPCLLQEVIDHCDPLTAFLRDGFHVDTSKRDTSMPAALTPYHGGENG